MANQTSSSPSSTLPSGPARGFVTIRAMAIACALMPLLALWVVQAELIWYSSHSTAISLFFHVTFVLFVLALGNLVVQRYWPAAALSPGELMTIYTMLAVGATFCSHDLIQILIPMLAFPAYAANPLNRYDELILQYLPTWSYVTDKSVLNGLAVGGASLYKMDVLRAWAKPLAYWSLFLGALIAALTSINIFFRKHWTEKEKLSFPIIQIPLMITTGLGSLLRNKLFWIAFGIAAFIDVWNGFNHFFPVMPAIPIVRAFEFREYLVERPWDAIGDTTIYLYPFVIGLTFFIPTDLAFSCWFFYLFFRLQMVLTSAIGIRDLPGFPFPNEQAAGGYLALGVLAIWLSRRHLIGIGRTILGRSGGVDDSDEPISYRANFFIFLVACVVLIWFGMELGARWWIMGLFFLIFFLYSIAIARMRAELGPPAHDLHAMGPEILLNNALGSVNHVTGAASALPTEGDRATFSLFFWFNRAYRAHYSAHNIEGFKIAQQMRITSRSMYKAMLVAAVVGILAAYWAMLHALYVHGYSGRAAGDAFSSEAWTRMAGWMDFPLKPRIAACFATVFGVIFSLVLGLLRMKFTWWLWHPVGYATATSWSMQHLWFPIMVGWTAKALITRYGGAAAYRKALPFFVGLVLGEFTVGSLWGIFGAIAGEPVYHWWG